MLIGLSVSLPFCKLCAILTLSRDWMLDLYACLFLSVRSGLQMNGLTVLSCTAPFLYYFVLYRFCVVLGLYCMIDHCRWHLLVALLVFLNICLHLIS